MRIGDDNLFEIGCRAYPLSLTRCHDSATLFYQASSPQALAASTQSLLAPVYITRSVYHLTASSVPPALSFLSMTRSSMSTPSSTVPPLSVVCGVVAAESRRRTFVGSMQNTSERCCRSSTVYVEEMARDDRLPVMRGAVRIQSSVL